MWGNPAFQNKGSLNWDKKIPQSIRISPSLTEDRKDEVYYENRYYTMIVHSLYTMIIW